jgi:VanZ family protein
VVAVAAFIFYTSILTTPPAEPVIPKFDPVPLDKWRHFLAYAAFGGSLAYATTDRDREPWQLAAFVLGVTVVYGIGIEYWQSFIPNRYFSVGDAYANALGALLVTPWYFLRSRLTLWPILGASSVHTDE